MQLRRPVFDMLTKVSSRGRFHMPGHKGLAPFGPVDPYLLDQTEIPETDDLYAPEGALQEAMQMYAAASGAADTIFLHNGSSCGIHIMLQLYAREGDTILLPRNAHHSAVHAAVIGGLKVRWIPVRMTDDGYIWIHPDDVLASMDRHPEAKVLLLTRPDYYGGCIPLDAITAHAHHMNIRVVIDEAHGAHLPWMPPEISLRSSGCHGADAWTQSVHKTLPGWTGSAVLQLAHTEDLPRAMTIMRREQTSSPSFLLMMSIDDSRAWMEANGSDALHQVIEAADELRSMLPDMGYRDGQEQWHDTGYRFDPTRVVIDAPQGGYRLQEQLRRMGIDAELSDEHRVVLILTAMDSVESIRHFTEILRSVSAEKVCIAPPSFPAYLPEQKMEVRPAVMAESHYVSLRQAAGYVSAVSAGLYPPGIPMVCPGEVITEETAARLLQAPERQRFGTKGESIECVKL